MALMRDMVDDMFVRVRLCKLNRVFFSLTVVQMKWLPPHVGHTLPFHSAIQALTLLQSGKTTGKVLLQVNQS